MQPLRNKKLLVLVMLLVWFALLGAVYADHQNIFDWLALRNYQAPSAVGQLATQDTMTPYARKIFYVNHPGINDKSDFSQKCPNNGGEQTIVLGCYKSDQAGIYLLNVSDPRLDGVEQVTAAHEMLHAAYDRLSSSERKKVDAMLVAYYNHDLHDQRILSTIAAYKKSEPNDVVNEMHSVFGTEVATLPAGLEQYYQRYFTNRAQIASYAAQYQAEFTSRQATVLTDDVKLKSLKSQIDNEESDLNSKQAGINLRRDQLAAEQASNPTAYNADVPAYNQQVDAFNAEVGQLKNLINQYNGLVMIRNAIAIEEDQLVNDLTSNVTPINN